ncbi:MAG: glycosyltransferase family 4 protein [Flavobacteriales bacterium]|nr:glycosyltransferase family 4 protein [Flavobacteriales bacterium]
MKPGLLYSLLRDAFRLLTYSPVALLRQRRALHGALKAWNGHHLFTFPYMCVGGAEQIHADILAAIADRSPLVLICSYNEDRSFEERFRSSADVVEVNLLVNHPFTRRAAGRVIAKRLNAAPAPTLLSSLTDTFFDLLPLLQEHVRAYHLQHAFLFQPDGNTQQKRWMTRFHRVNRFIFYSGQAMRDWERFMRANGIPCDREETFAVLPNAVWRFHEPQQHDRPGVLFVGRQSPVKRLELFLEIADRLERESPRRFRFSVAGYDAIGNHPHVTFHGRVGDPERLSAIYSAHDIVVQTSTLEGYPVVIMEAMAHGLAVISTPVGDVPNQVTAEFALLNSAVDAATVVRESAAFIRGLEQDQDRLLRMRRSAYDHARKAYDPEAFRARYRAFLGVTSGNA